MPPSRRRRFPSSTTALSLPKLSWEGLARCAGCGYTLKIAGNKDRYTGESFPVYYCKGRSAKGKCSDRASIRASYLDDFVEGQVFAALQDEDGLLAQAVHASQQIEEAQREVEATEHELVLYLETDLVSTIGQGVKARQQRLDDARDKLAVLRAQTVVVDELLTGDLLEAWPELTIPEKRQLLHGLLEKVTLTCSDGRKRATHKPIEEQTEIILRGGGVLQRVPFAKAT